MTCEQALSYLASLNESRIKPGLERIRQALSALGSPHLKFPHVLIGGTNGKGSVVSFMGEALVGAGYRTGLFTSPHLHRFEERIVVDKHGLNAEELVYLVKTVKDVGVDLTYFEFAAAMALLHFARNRVDLAILEVGIGGRWDATNVTNPVLSMITTVEVDHQNWLGDSLEEIALEKAGIMREGKPVIVGPLGAAARQVVIRHAEDVGARVILFERDFCVARNNTVSGLQFEGMKWSIEGLIPGLKGLFQFENAGCALAALEALEESGFEITAREAAYGIESASWIGRLQKVEGTPPFIVDAAHNPAAVRALIASLEGVQQVVWLFSALSEKDVAGMIEEMSRLSSRFVLVQMNHPRARTVRELKNQMPDGAEIIESFNVRQGVDEARNLAGKAGCVVVAGSVVLAGEVLKVLEEDQFGV